MNLEESRYDRAERITWWDQAKLKDSKVLIVGAGALGNEIVKNLVLVGIGQITVIDMDDIEHSNLSRCVFFRDGDEGRFKSELLAERAGQLNPDVKVEAVVGPVQSLGSAAIADFDLVIGALDNREARLWVSRSCRMNGKVFIDAAIEGLHAVVRVFEPTGPCYACTLSEVDWQVLNRRRSCALLQRDDLASGKTPTNATTSSIASAIQAQEAIKYLVGKTDIAALGGKAWHLMGEELATFTVLLSENEDCSEHHEFFAVEEAPSDWSNLRELHSTLSADADVIWLTDDLVHIKDCSNGHGVEKVGLSSILKSKDAICTECSEELETESVSMLNSGFSGLDVHVDKLILPKSEFFMVTKGMATKAVKVVTR